MNVLTQLLISPFRNCVMDILTPLTINETFPITPRFNVNIEAVQSALKPAEMGLWENNNHVWPLRDRSQSPVMQTEGKSIFMLLFRSHWISTYHRNDTSLTNFRHNLLKPMIRLGLDVNYTRLKYTHVIRRESRIC